MIQIKEKKNAFKLVKYFDGSLVNEHTRSRSTYRELRADTSGCNRKNSWDRIADPLSRVCPCVRRKSSCERLFDTPTVGLCSEA